MAYDLTALKAALGDLPALSAGLSVTDIGGRRVFGFDGLVASVDAEAPVADIAAAIRQVYSLHRSPPLSTPLPAQAPLIQPSPKPMSTPAPGSFAADLRKLMDEARAGLVKARQDGANQVKAAVGKLTDAQTATLHVTSSMAKTIEDEASAVMSELGQISNSLGGENG